MARIENDQREMAYRFYISESLFASGQNRHLTRSFTDVMRDFDRPKDTRTAEEIIEETLSRLGVNIL